MPAAASIWKLSATKWLRASPAVVLHRVSQGTNGQVSDKPTGLLAARLPTLHHYIHTKQGYTAPLPKVQTLTGKDATGKWNTAQAKEYTPSFCRAIALAVHDTLASNTNNRLQADDDATSWDEYDKPYGFDQLRAQFDVYDPTTAANERGHDYAVYNCLPPCLATLPPIQEEPRLPA